MSKSELRSTTAAARKAKGLAMLADGAKIADVTKACGVERTIVSRWAGEIRQEANARLDAVTDGIADGAALAKASLSRRGEALADILFDAANGTLRVPDGAGADEDSSPSLYVTDPAMVNARANAAAKGLAFILAVKSETDVGSSALERVVSLMRSASEARKK